MVCTTITTSLRLSLNNLRYRHKGLKSRINAMMFITTLIMFGVAVAHWGLTMVFFINTMLASILSCGPETGSVDDFVAREWLPFINVWSSLVHIKRHWNDINLTCTQIILTDAIVLWRTWVVLGRKSKLFLVAGYSIVLGRHSTPFFKLGAGKTDTPTPLEACVVITLALKFTDYAMFACTIAINLFSTAIMCYKTWYRTAFNTTLNLSSYPNCYVPRTHRRLMKRNDILALNAAAVQMILVLLVESGALYCMLWVSTFTRSPLWWLGIIDS